MQRRGVVGAVALMGALMVPLANGTIARAGSDDATPGVLIADGTSDGFTALGALQLRSIGSRGTAEMSTWASLIWRPRRTGSKRTST